MFFVLLNMYLSKHCMLFTCGGNKEYYYYFKLSEYEDTPIINTIQVNFSSFL